MDSIRALAQARSGKCLSTVYEHNKKPLQWRCKQGHEWEALIGPVRRGTWCPYCHLKNEQECRQIFETLAKRKFPKKRPEWLENLELDGFCEELGLAFEYNGKQHYEVVPFWHENDEDDLEQQQARDREKQSLCDDNWVTLIVIPFTLTGAARIEHIRKELELLIGIS